MENGKAALNGHSNGHSNGMLCDVKSMGKSLKKTAENHVELTHELAKELIGMPTFIGERPLRKRHMGSLLQSMRRGIFLWEFVNLVTCRCAEAHNGHPAGTVFRMNGQHTCNARLEMPANYRASCKMIRYAAATEEDMRRLYASLDRNSPRTKSNVINSYIAGSEAFDGYTSHVRKYVPAGLSLWKWERSGVRSSHDGDDVAYLLLESESEVTSLVASFLDQWSYKEHRHLMRAPVIGAMFATFSVDQQAAATFWTAVASGVNLSSERDPRKKLRDTLMTSNIGIGAGARQTGSARLSQEAMYRLAIMHWNLWRSGRQCKCVRIPERRPVPE